MPRVALLGDYCTGHGCWPARVNDEGSPDVFVNDIPWHRQGDHWVSHCCTHPQCIHGCHDSVLLSGSETVYVNDRQAGLVGDPVKCGGVVAGPGSDNVFCGP